MQRADCDSDNDSDSGKACCPICLSSNGELLQRGCCCRGAAGVVHLQCMISLAEHSNNWATCGTCKEQFTGSLLMSLAQEWWSRVESQPEDSEDRMCAAGNLANAYSDQGKYAEAEVLERELLATRKRMLGEEHPNTLCTAGNLANSYSSQGKYAEAEVLQCELLATQKRVLGEEHPDTLCTAGNLAITYSDQGKDGEADVLQCELLATHK